MSLRLSCLIFAVCLTAITVRSQTPMPEPPAPAAAGQADELVGPIKLPDADIDTVLGLLEIYTGRSILRPQQLPTATYRLVIERKIPKSEAVLALETVLALNQVGVAPLGDRFLKVVALSQVKTEAPEMITGSTLSLPASGRIATKLFQLNFLRVNEFVPQLTPLMSPGIANGIVPLDKANAALITDTVSNLQRVEQLIEQLDQPTMAGLTPKFYQLRNGAKASDVVTKIHAMFQGPLQTQLGASVSFSADDRTNQIILLADPRQVPLFDDLIGRLDVKADPITSNEVIYLKHASAKDVAPLLSQLVSGQTNAAQKAGGSSVRNPLLPPAAPNQPAPQTAAPDLATVVGDKTNEFSALMTIIADERSNSVIVSGTVDDIRLIHELIDKIDVLLAQVSIEVIIAEVTLTNSDTSGINALNLTVATDNVRGTHITNFNTPGSSDSANYGLAGWAITSGVVNPLSFSAALQNTGTKNNVKVLSANTIVTTHNKEADFVVSQKQPIITGVTASPISSAAVTSTAGFATSSQVTYQDIGIEVKVTPLIGGDGSIQLKVDQKVDDVVGNVTIDNNQQPIIGHREAQSWLNAQDGQMVVLGGLQQSKVSQGRTKLGFFFEIPILSQLLGARNHEIDRTELLLFIRPHVIHLEEAAHEAVSQINNLSSKEQVNQYLKDPSKPAKEKLIDRVLVK